MNTDYGYVLLFLCGGLLMVGAALGAAFLLSSTRIIGEKLTPYECGELPQGTSYVPMDIKFYMAALLFVVFDVEVVFLLPWALCFKELGMAGFISVNAFLLVLFLGWAYAWKKGVIKWE